jgi:hypothetical protein
MAVHPQPALLAMTAELPSGEQRLQAGNSVNTPLLFPALLEKAEGQQYAGTGLARRLRAGIDQALQGGVAETLSQLKSPRTCQVKVLALTGRSEAQAWGAVPQELKGAFSRQAWQLLQRILRGHL